jgi:DNA-binding IscR family transcriptional regulator
MLTLTKKAEYALIALCHLSRVPRDTVVSAREIAESHHVPLPLLQYTDPLPLNQSESECVTERATA